MRERGTVPETAAQVKRSMALSREAHVRLLCGGALAVALALVVLIAGAAGAEASTATIGELSLTPSSANLTMTGQSVPVFQGDASGNYVLTVPHDGVITSWSFLSGGASTGATFVLRRLQPTNGTGTGWRALGSSEAVAVTTASGVDAINGPFTTSIPVSAGDRIALEPVSGSLTPIEHGVLGEDGIRYFAAPLSEGSSATLTEGESDNGQVVPIQAIETYSAESSESAPSATTPVNTSLPTISGTPKAGQTLTCNPGSWSGSPSFTYTWSQSTFALVAGSKPPRVTKTSVEVATGSTYTLPDLPVGVSISCTVTATNAATAGVGPPKASSEQLAVQASAPALASAYTGGRLIHSAGAEIIGDAGYGGTDICYPGRWLHYPTSFAYRWYEERYDAQRHLPYLTEVGASSRLKPRIALELHHIFCKVIASNAAGTASSTSRTVLVPQAAPIASGLSRIEVEDPTPAEINPATSAAAPIQPGSDGELRFACLSPKFNRPLVAVTHEWQIDLHGFFPPSSGIPDAEIFETDVSVSGALLAISPQTPTHEVEPLATEPGRGLEIDGAAPQSSVPGAELSEGQGEFGYIKLRCVTIAKLSHSSSAVQSTLLYVIAVER